MAKIAPPAGTLKKLVDAGKKNSRVLSSVERWILAQPGDSKRATNVIHPSAMVKPDWCHRAEYFTIQGATPAPSKFKASMKQHLTFEEGHRIHARWQDWFGQMGKLYGKWYCEGCGNEEWLLSGDIHETAESECGPWTYREVPVHSYDHRISGHADGWLKGFGEDLLLEIKSVGEGTFRWEDPMLWEASGKNFKKAWESLKGPFYSHLMQAQVYMKLLEIMNPDDHPKEAIFIYESKVDQELKEFVVSKSDFGVTELFDAALKIVDAIDKQVPPACNIDPAGCYKCKVHDGD